MILREQKKGDIDILELSGRFIMENSQLIRDRSKELIDEGSGKLIVNLEKVTFIDSSGCAVLISIFKNMQTKLGRLVLVTNPVVQSLLELTRLHTIFEIQPTLDMAVAVLSDE